MAVVVIIIICVAVGLPLLKCRSKIVSDEDLAQSKCRIARHMDMANSPCIGRDAKEIIKETRKRF